MAEKCILLSGDLMLASQVSGAASRVSCALQNVAHAESLLSSLRERPCDLAIIDLTTPGLDIGRLVSSLRALEQPPKHIIAFGPHVQTGRLTHAQEAGCDEVLTRGQFYSRMDEILRGAD